MSSADDEAVEMLRRMFADLPPRDVAGRGALTLETVRAMNDAAGRALEVTEPGEVTLDVDGVPSGVGESTTTVAALAPLMISRAEADRLGVTTEEFPHVRIVG